jgi:hypothetical protein
MVVRCFRLLTWKYKLGFASPEPNHSSIFLDSRLLEIRIVDTKTCHNFIKTLRVFTRISFLLISPFGAS